MDNEFNLRHLAVSKSTNTDSRHLSFKAVVDAVCSYNVECRLRTGIIVPMFTYL